MVEDLGFNKYRVRVDGSGRVTDRNRLFLRLFKLAKSTFLPGPAPFTNDKDPQPLPGAGHVPVDEPLADPEQVPDALMTDLLDTANRPSRSQHDNWNGN